MSLIPLLDDSTDSIRESLSLQEIQIALSFLRKRFKEYSPKQIILSLNDYLFQKEYSTNKNYRNGSNRKLIKPYRNNLKQREFCQIQQSQDRTEKNQRLKLVSKLFCESGIKFSLAQYFFPDMTIKEYKQNLEIIAAQTLNNIEKYLRYECNVAIQQLSKKQKKSIRQKCVNIRDWMPKTHPQLFEVYLKFIERHYQNQYVQIEFKDALSLHKLILESAKGPQLLLQDQAFANDYSKNHKKVGLTHQLQLSETYNESVGQCNSQECNAIIILFKKYGSISKISDFMCQKFGYSVKWSTHSIKHVLKKIYKISLKKLINSCHQYLKKEKIKFMFSYSDQDVNTLADCQNAKQTKEVLLDFFIAKKVTILKLKETIQKVNDFYSLQFDVQDIYEGILVEQDVILPQLIKGQRQHNVQAIEIKDQPIQIEIKGQNEENMINLDLKKSRKSKKQNLRQKRIFKQKRANFKEVVEIDPISEQKKKSSRQSTNLVYHKNLEVNSKNSKASIKQRSPQSEESQPQYSKSSSQSVVDQNKANILNKAKETIPQKRRISIPKSSSKKSDINAQKNESQSQNNLLQISMKSDGHYFDMKKQQILRQNQVTAIENIHSQSFQIGFQPSQNSSDNSYHGIETN